MKNEWIRGKTVVIVGASAGVGKHLAFNLILKYNCKILAISNEENEMESYYNKLGEYASNMEYYIFDAQDEKNWVSFAENLKQNDTNIDALINCVGELPKFSSFENYTQKDLVRYMNINFYSSVFAIRHLLPFLKKSSRPAIVNMSCLASSLSVGGTSIYSASKSALKSYTEVLADELDQKFYIGLVLLGVVSSDFYKNQEQNISKKLLSKATTPLSASNSIIKGILRKKRRIVVGIDANIYYHSSRLFPNLTHNFIKARIKRKNLKLY